MNEADSGQRGHAARTLEIVAEGLAFGEAPRWYDGKLWWSDMHAGQVSRLVNGTAETVCQVPNRPSGLGWLPDGRMLVVSMSDKRVLRREMDGTLVTHADLGALVPRRLNDMVVDREGRAYVGNFGFELDQAEEQRPTVLVCVEPDGAARVVADDLLFPNGAVLAEGGRVLVVAETFAARLSAFDVDTHGNLSRRRVWAQLPERAVPDGICLDSQGAIWVASPTTNECLRLQEGGAVLDRVPADRGVYACALGGPDRRTLYLCTARSHDPVRQAREHNGRIESVDVEVAGD
jgi:sugar lactone lactonase YvrE